MSYLYKDTRTTIFYDGTAEARLHDILCVMDSETFGKRKSECIVGGPAKLNNLVLSGKIRMELENNGRTYYNAADVLRHARNRNKKRIKKTAFSGGSIQQVN